MADEKGHASPMNEGEGNRTADRNYRKGVEKTVREGHAEQDAEQARREVDANPEEFERAEKEGRSRTAGEAPGDLER
jgi:hypothetical protein